MNPGLSFDSASTSYAVMLVPLTEWPLIHLDLTR